MAVDSNHTPSFRFQFGNAAAEHIEVVMQASKQGENNGGWAGRGQRGVEKRVALGKSLLPVEVRFKESSREKETRPVGPQWRKSVQICPIAHAARI